MNILAAQEAASHYRASVCAVVRRIRRGEAVWKHPLLEECGRAKAKLFEELCR